MRNITNDSRRQIDNYIIRINVDCILGPTKKKKKKHHSTFAKYNSAGSQGYALRRSSLHSEITENFSWIIDGSCSVAAEFMHYATTNFQLSWWCDNATNCIVLLHLISSNKHTPQSSSHLPKVYIYIYIYSSRCCWLSRAPASSEWEAVCQLWRLIGHQLFLIFFRNFFLFFVFCSCSCFWFCETSTN